MTNVKMAISGTILTIEVDLSKRNGPSGSGKTTIIGSSNGIAYLTQDPFREVGVGVNVFTRERK